MGAGGRGCTPCSTTKEGPPQAGSAAFQAQTQLTETWAVKRKHWQAGCICQWLLDVAPAERAATKRMNQHQSGALDVAVALQHGIQAAGVNLPQHDALKEIRKCAQMSGGTNGCRRACSPLSLLPHTSGIASL